jgi:3-phenylpropionate/trans-cinnamate dioxygenase ferredoxin reductase subunit
MGSAASRPAAGDATPGGHVSDQTFVIVGASLAGAKAAQTLREEGFDGRVILLGEEQERPYERPPLSKEYLKGDAGREKIWVHDETWYADNDVDLRTGVQVTAIDRDAHEVGLADGARQRYDKLLLATGSAPRRVALPGADLDGVLYLRTVGDSDRIRDALAAAGRVVIVGAGWIGLETAAAARHHGAEVIVVEPEPQPLNRVLGPELGAFFADVHRRNGVDLRLGAGLQELRGTGRIERAVLSDGTEVDASTVIVGVGVMPRVGLATAAGLDVDNGVVVDEMLRTSDPDIYAAGDVMNARNPLLGRQVRVEHWANALNSGPAAARSMLGKGEPYDRVPYFFSDQYDVGMEYSGWAPSGSYDQVVYRGDRDGGEFIAFWLSQGRVLAGMNVNVWDVTGPIQALIRSGKPVDVDRLTDADVPLESLTEQAGAAS